MKKRFLSTLMALCLALSLLPTAAFAAEGGETPVEEMPVEVQPMEVQPMEEPLVEETAGPTASGTNFFANGTPITITASAPEDATEANFDSSFTAIGTDGCTSAYISWDEDGTTKYVGVSENVSIYGGKDGSASAVTVPSTSITMTGGKVANVYGGNRGSQDKSAEKNSKVTGNVTMNFSGDAKVWNLLHGGGAFNTRVEGTVFMNFENATAMNDRAGGVWPYINGGVYGNGSEGTRNIEEGTMDTYAVVNRVKITATNSNLYLVGAGGSGSTKVLSGSVVLDKCELTSLFLGGINGEVEDSSITATGCKIESFSATNRGFVGEGYVDLNGCEVTELNTGAATGCFTSDSGGTDGSGVTGSCVWDLDESTEVEDAQLTPLVIKNSGSYTNTYENLTVQKAGAPLGLEITSFVADVNDGSETQNAFTVPEGSALTLNNVQTTVTAGQTLTNAGTINMDTDSKLTVDSGATLGNAGTINGTYDNTGGGTITEYAARVGSTGYTTLQKAIGAAGEKDTITLLQNVELDGTDKVNNEGLLTITGNKTITIDGQGKYTISGTNIKVDGTDGPSLINIQGGAKVTLQNLKLDGGTTQTNFSDGAKHGVNINGAGEVTLQNVTIENCRWYGVVVNNAKATLDTVTMRNTQWGVNVDKNGSAELVNSNIPQDVVYESDDECSLDVESGSYGTIKVQQTTDEETKGTVSIMGGTVEQVVTDGDKIESATADIVIAGGTVKGDVTNTSAGKVEITGEETTVNGSVTNSGAGTMVISGGTINGKVSGNRTTISGGKFPNASADDLKDMLAGNAIIITFNANGGTCSEKLRVIVKDQAISTLPTPFRTGYTFDGWYVGNVKVETNSSFTSDTTLTAQWSAKSQGGSSSSEPSYSPVMDVSKGGSVKVNPRTPGEGDEVTITVDPDRGYEVGDVTVTDRSGRDVRVTAERDGTYTFEQPKGRVTIAVTFVREGTSTFFADVAETYWAYDEIAWAYENGYVNGVTATTFAPGASISRQQIWMILARIAGDDPADMAAARQWSIDNGISDGTNPGSAVTRQQLAALLYRYAQMMGYANEARVDLSSFPDAGSVASYAVEPMQWSVANSIVGGTTDGTLNPTGTATRAQFAVMLYRFWTGV